MGTTKRSSSSAVGGGVDGRRAWRDRNRNAVVDALLDFYEEDNGSPGAQAIAERSGVSRRSLFRYFDDMDELCRAAIVRHSDRVSHLFEIRGLGEGELEERIDRLVDQRVQLFEAIASVRRIARLRARTQPIIADEMARSGVLLRRQIERHFEPEMSMLNAAERRDTLAAVDVLMSFESFDLMRGAQGLSLARVGDAMRRALQSLIA
jgi:AcrR family transcriptional regulator